ncbi:hypothetical protein HPB47_013681 [Ixodes persulcatus]|uniref:Uncharacterized protein n=1 Tax=Ixodes persulcatus TaxID=34615 RepID=A0AC60R281_IXOPE|nr:hypothetical protein HPB47_013681 [Ixodes persulcatus]
MCLRYKFVDPERFHHLETLQVGWNRKRNILNDYRNCTRDHLQTVKLYSQWSEVLRECEALSFGYLFCN